jgi:hypothetical protein
MQEMVGVEEVGEELEEEEVLQMLLVQKGVEEEVEVEGEGEV